MSLNPGTRFGPYEILDALGAGGMGEVYRAKDTRLDRSVAIKILPGHLSANPELRQRFDREARAISSLSHPHICALYDVGHEEGTDFLVMEYLEGQTLAEKLSAGPLPLEDVLRMGRQIAEALAAAHRSGVVHRDLKPGNIMLTRSGVKLLDFGLARMGVEAEAPSSSSLTMKAPTADPRTPLTAEGTILGTFQYMAPEQLEGAEADARTDIFALGAVLYEMLTGRRAFEGKSQASLIASIMSASPAPISQVVPLAPPALDRVVRTCLKKDPEERWQTAHDVALQLEWIAEGGSAAGVPKPVAHRRRSRERLAWVAASVLTLVAVGSLGYLFTHRSHPDVQTLRYRIDTPSALTFMDSPKLSPNGRYLAFNGTDSTGISRIWVQPLDAFTAHALDGTEGARRPIWSPESKSLAFFADGRLKRVDVSGGPVQTLTDVVNGSDGSWSPEGVILFDASAGDSLQRVPAGGGVPAPATRLNRALHEVTHGWPYFLPDGKHFVFQVDYADAKVGSLKVGELGDFKTTTLGPGNTRIEFAEPGYLLYVGDGTLLARRFDPGGLKFEGDPFPVTEAVTTTSYGLADFSLSGNGILAYRRGEAEARRLAWCDAEGKVTGTLGKPAGYMAPAIDPTGTRVAVSIVDDKAGTYDIWVLEIARGTASRLTFDPANDFFPVWSPDGSRVAYANTAGGRADILAKDANGTGEPDSVWTSDVSKYPTSWSPDGRTLLCQRPDPKTKFDIWAVPMTGDGKPYPVVQSPGGDGLPAFSPDGRWIAYNSDESQVVQVYVRPFPKGDGRWQVSIDSGREPQWSRDGKWIYYLSDSNDLMRAPIQTEGGFRAGTPQRVFQAHVVQSLQSRDRFQVTADPNRFLLVTENASQTLAPTTVVVNWAAEIARR